MEESIGPDRKHLKVPREVADMAVKPLLVSF